VSADEEARNRLEQAPRPWTDRCPDVRVRRVAVESVRDCGFALVEVAAQPT
jgi:hypothetical protein